MCVVPPSSIGKKIREIREAEGLTRQKFFELTGIPIKTQTFYETDRREGVGSNILFKITRHPRFKKYTMWLMTDEVDPSSGQVAPNLSESKTITVKSGGLIEEVTAQISSQQPDMKDIIISLSNLDDDELKQLSRLLSRKGVMLLLELLDTENQSLIKLEGKKRRAALRLESMSGEQLREILSKIDECDISSKEDINHFIEKAS